MEMQTLVNEFKGRIERVGVQTQDAYKSYVDARKKAYGVVSSNVQTLVRTETDTMLGLYGAASERFSAARKESIKSVIFVPVDILPEGRERLISAYREARSHFVKTRDELLSIALKGFEDIRGSFAEAKSEAKTMASKSATQAKTTVNKAEKQASAAKTQAKKGASQAKTQAKKSATEAKKGASQAKTQAKKSATQAKKGVSQAKTQAKKTASSANGNGTAKSSS